MLSDPDPTRRTTRTAIVARGPVRVDVATRVTRHLPALAAVLTVLAGAGGARAHPHVFIDGGVDFRFDTAGRLTDLRVTWIFDPLTSLFMLEDLGIAAEGSAPLARNDRARLAAYQTEWIEG